MLLIGASFLLLPHLLMLIVIAAFGRRTESWMLPAAVACSVADFIGIFFLAWAVTRLLLFWWKTRSN
jgi:hypothetical protein